jgi:hypothetical protein
VEDLDPHWRSPTAAQMLVGLRPLPVPREMIGTSLRPASSICISRETRDGVGVTEAEVVGVEEVDVRKARLNVVFV